MKVSKAVEAAREAVESRIKSLSEKYEEDIKWAMEVYVQRLERIILKSYLKKGEIDSVDIDFTPPLPE